MEEGYLCRFSLHVLVMHGGERHQFKFLLFPIVVSIMFFLLKRLLIESFQFLPKIFVELIQRKILLFFKFMEETFLKNTYRVFY